MKFNFTILVHKIIELDKQMSIHNNVIEGLRIRYVQKEKEYLALDRSLLHKDMLLLGLFSSNEINDFEDYRNSKYFFFRHMVEMDLLFNQVKVLIKVFLNYDFVIDGIDLSKPLNFNLGHLLNQVSIYPKRLSLLLKRGVIDDMLYNSLYNEDWLNQSVQGCSGLFVELIKQFEMYHNTLLESKKCNAISIISEAIYKSDGKNIRKKLSNIMEYLFCPKIDEIFLLEDLITKYGYKTDEMIDVKLSELKNII